MLYNLPNGKVIEISVEEYLDMSDEELEYLIALNYGENIENPFFGSVLQKQPPVEPEEPPSIIIIGEDPTTLAEEIDYEFPEEE
jgi:hypothetical protein